MVKKTYFIESDFDLWIDNSIIFKSPYKFIKHFYQRIITNAYYCVKLLFLKRKSIVIAPWWLFIIPAILNKVFRKDFVIISLTCDTFLSEKTINTKNNSLFHKIKYCLARFTYNEPLLYVYCSEVVKRQLLSFGIPKNKLVYKYQEWIRYQDRYERYLDYNIVSKSMNNSFLFIWHYYHVLQKRLDVLIDSFTQLFEDHPDISLTIIGWGWEKFFWKGKIDSFLKYNIRFIWYEYNVDKYFYESTFYVHPGEFEWFWVSILEAMLCWCIPLISDKTWAEEAVSKVSKDLVVWLNVQEFYDAMSYLVNLDMEERASLSTLSKEKAISYNYKNSIEWLRESILFILEEKLS